jgi:RNA polymerase sigma factor (sigma-70 family)
VETIPLPADEFAASVHARFHEELHRFLARRLGNDQEVRDLTQEVYLRLLRLDRAELIRQPEAYVYTIAAHVLHQFRMRIYASPVTFDSEAMQLAAEAPQQIQPDRQAERLNAEREVARILQRLPPTHRAVLVLCKRDGCSYEEVAQRLSISVHTVKKYLFEAKAWIVGVTKGQS